ncbi:MAG: hypothetical protein WC674_07750 [Candidatus Krumholzibacteriia bacterium]
MKRVRDKALASAKWAAGIAIAISAAALPVRAAGLFYTGSALFSSGTYGFTERTTGFSLSNGLNLYVHPFRVSATVPAIGQSTPLISTTATGVIPDGSMGDGKGSLDASETSYSSVYGIGDPVVRVDLEAFGIRAHLPAMQIFGQTKIPLADPADGLGTGEWDFTAGLSLSKSAGRNFVLVEAAYWMLGDSPEAELENPFSLNASLGRSFAGRKAMASAIFSACTEIVPGTEPPRQIGAGFNYLTRSGRGIGGTAMIGLSESTSDVSVSLGWTIPLN